MRRLIAALSALAVAGTLISTGGVAHAEHDTKPCGDVTVVFARGSGQALNKDEAQRFFGQIDKRTRDGVKLNAYEVGTEEHGGKQYEAVGVKGSLQSFKNLLEADASWTGFLGGRYNASVAGGVTETRTYLTERAARCKDEQFVLGGYSQGAHVIGNTLAELDRDLRDRIAYVGLFGDPKLYLPEGQGVFPPACRGGDRSPWRRGNVGCFTDNGSLEARVPYLPADIANRVGSWCDRDDLVCNNNLADLIGSTHENYAKEGNGIDEAAQEVAEALAGRLPGHRDDFDLSIFVIGVGTTGLDVAIVIDTTGSMADDIDAARLSARTLATTITSLRGRVALTEYRDAGDSFVAAVRSPLSNDIAAFETALAPLVASGGGDTPEALLTALMTTFNELSWKPGATKAVVVLTDADYHDPDVANGWTLDQVATRALEIDPVNVYPVVPDFLSAQYALLAQQTSGKVVVNSGDTQAALIGAITQIKARPTALLAVDEYWAAPGTEVQFDASRSYDPDSTLTKYEWDFDGDGTIDATTNTPTAKHKYASAFEGLAQVRIHSADGGVANAIATMHINTTGLAKLGPAAPTTVTAKVTEVDATNRTATLTWTPGSGAGTVKAWRVYDGAGALIGQAPGNKAGITVTNVPNTAATFAVAASNAYGTSDTVRVTVPARAGATPTASPELTDGSPSPSASKSPAAVPVPAQLGRTGSNISVIAVLGVSLLLLGAVILFAARRRRRAG
jgi:LPXTG-motif cell wall-anchored protein